MAKYTLPPVIHMDIYKAIQPSNHEKEDKEKSGFEEKHEISASLTDFLKKGNQEIKQNRAVWEKVRPFINTYQYLYHPLPGSKYPICKEKSAGDEETYFKMVETINTFQLFICGIPPNKMRSKQKHSASLVMLPPGLTQYSVMKTLYMSERERNVVSGIEAFYNMRRNPLDRYVGIIYDRADPLDHRNRIWKNGTGLNDRCGGQKTCAPENNNSCNMPPQQHYEAMSKQTYLHYFNDMDKTMTHLVNTHAHSVDIFVADMHETFVDDIDCCAYASTCFEEGKEVRQNTPSKHTYKANLIMEICAAIKTLKKGGHLILKTGMLRTTFEIELVYFLSAIFSNLTFFKSNAMYYVESSERYLLCRGFIFDQPDADELFYRLMDYHHHNNNNHHHHHQMSIPFERLFDPNVLSVPLFFKRRVEEANNIIGYPQIDMVYYTLSFVENKFRSTEKLENICSKNIAKCVEWCKRLGVPYYKFGSGGGGGDAAQERSIFLVDKIYGSSSSIAATATDDDDDIEDDDHNYSWDTGTISTSSGLFIRKRLPSNQTTPFGSSSSSYRPPIGDCESSPFFSFSSIAQQSSSSTSTSTFSSCPLILDENGKWPKMRPGEIIAPSPIVPNDLFLVNSGEACVSWPSPSSSSEEDEDSSATAAAAASVLNKQTKEETTSSIDSSFQQIIKGVKKIPTSKITQKNPQRLLCTTNSFKTLFTDDDSDSGSDIGSDK